MGIDNIVKQMDPKLKKLLMNILSILMILTISFGLLNASMMYVETGDFLSILSMNVLIPIILPLIFIWFAYSILSGKKINPPDELMAKKGEKTKFNIPDTYGVRGNIKKEKKPQPQITRAVQHKSYGTWSCPRCGFLAKGVKCAKCGYLRR